MLVVVSIPITGNTTKKHDITGWFAWGWKVNILPKIFGQTMFVSEQFQNAVIYAFFYKIRLKMAWKNSAGEGIRTPASQRPTGWLVFLAQALFVHIGSRGQRDNHSATPA
jgi:hypothetical protein